MLRGGFFWTAASFSAAAFGDAPQARIDRVSPPDQNFFSKKTFAEKIPIEAHADVPDAALRAGAERVSRMLTHAPRIAANLRARAIEMEIAGKSQLISDLPPFHELRGTIFHGRDFDDDTRGAGHIWLKYVSCSEGNLLGYTNDLRYQHDICIHELAHAVMWFGMSPAARARFDVVFAKGKSRWVGLYAATDAAEYFAELSMWYFGSSSGQTPSYDSKAGPQWLAKYDPDGYAALDAIYTDRDDPGTCPLVTIAPQSPQTEGKTHSIEGKLPVTLTLHNGTSRTLVTYWLDYSGTRQFRETLLPGHNRTVYSYATHAWVVTETDDQAHAIYVVPTTDAEATVQP
jgi:broad specificity phosphatase PhoE